MITGQPDLSADTATAGRQGAGLRDILRQPRMLAILLLGGISGLPNQLSESILAGVVHRPRLHEYQDRPARCTRRSRYLLKPLWAPFLDRFVECRLARSSSAAASAVPACTMSRSPSPDTRGLRRQDVAQPDSRGCCSSSCSWPASQDIVIDAYRTDVARASRSAASPLLPRTSDIARPSWGFARDRAHRRGLLRLERAGVPRARGAHRDVRDRDRLGAGARRSSRCKAAHARRVGDRAAEGTSSACPHGGAGRLTISTRSATRSR